MATKTLDAEILEEQGSPWCMVCGVDHMPRGRCPGEVQASGPERPGWKVNVQTPRGIEAYGVLLARAGHRWRARVLTYPRVFWLVPGGHCTLKFLGKTPEEVERRAAAFIRDHCHERGYMLRDEVVVVDALPTDLRRPLRSEQEHPRFHRALPVRFGENRPIVPGVTNDLSEGGMFVVTEQPASRDQNLGVLLQLEHCSVPLRGAVVWVRRVPSEGRPAGMGLRLYNPPGIYLSYIRALAC